MLLHSGHVGKTVAIVLILTGKCCLGILGYWHFSILVQQTNLFEVKQSSSSKSLKYDSRAGLPVPVSSHMSHFPAVRVKKLRGIIMSNRNMFAVITHALCVPWHKFQQVGIPSGQDFELSGTLSCCYSHRTWRQHDIKGFTQTSICSVRLVKKRQFNKNQACARLEFSSDHLGRPHRSHASCLLLKPQSLCKAHQRRSFFSISFEKQNSNLTNIKLILQDENPQSIKSTRREAVWKLSFKKE